MGDDNDPAKKFAAMVKRTQDLIAAAQGPAARLARQFQESDAMKAIVAAAESPAMKKIVAFAQSPAGKAIAEAAKAAKAHADDVRRAESVHTLFTPPPDIPPDEIEVPRAVSSVAPSDDEWHELEQRQRVFVSLVQTRALLHDCEQIARLTQSGKSASYTALAPVAVHLAYELPIEDIDEDVGAHAEAFVRGVVTSPST